MPGENMGKPKDHRDGRARYKHRRYSCQQLHGRTYYYAQHENYLKHCRTWRCPIQQKKKDEFTNRRAKKISFGDGERQVEKVKNRMKKL